MSVCFVSLNLCLCLDTHLVLLRVRSTVEAETNLSEGLGGSGALVVLGGIVERKRK